MARRILVVGVDVASLVGLNLNNISAGWSVLNVAGQALPDTQSQFTFYPPDGNWYARHDNGGEWIYRLTPPASNPLTGTWTVTHVQLNTALPSPTQRLV